MSAASTKLSSVAELNDAFRKTVQIPGFGKSDIPGTVLATAGISALDPVTQIEIFARIRNFDEFTSDNDPYGEHDFGSVTHPKAGKVFWKFDYYDREDMRFGASDPSDPDATFRVLTIMLAEKY